jgi:alkanesulfonate monooxygenase SsuD/methylene tetrahydromethanopterin reductase-like flavin-dependent oxidoreductase (luciferase family)
VRLEELIGALRALWRLGAPPFDGRFYSTAGISLDPHPIREEGPPIWLGSWGSETGLRRTARLADGWLASAYNTTPALFGEAWAQLQDLLPGQGKDPEAFPNALSTMWFHITDSHDEADRIIQERLVPTIHRPEEVLRDRLPVGPADLFAEKLSAFARAGVQRVFVWPVADEANQLERFWETVRPAIAVS